MISGAASPSIRALQSRDNSPSPHTRPLARMPSIQRVNTSLPQGFSVTPASAHSNSSVAPSPYLTSIQSSPLVAQTNTQFAHLGSPGPLELPESVLSASHTISYKEISGSSKHTGLIRKLSQSAKDGVHTTRHILRRKASSSAQMRRDESTGPITRRRSDSKTALSNGALVDPPPYDIASMDPPLGIGLFDTMSISSEPTLVDSSPEGQAPCVPERLIGGSLLTKITKNKRQDKVFFLDVEGSRVSWKGAVKTKVFHIDNIKSIRSGEEAASYQQELRGEAVDPDLCFTINYTASDSSKSVKTIHLAAHNHSDLRLWIDTLECLAKHREQLMTSMTGSTQPDSILRLHWDNEIGKMSARLDGSKSDGLDLFAIQSLCRKLHIHAPEKELEENFNIADTFGSKVLNYDQFKNFVQRLRERRDLKQIFMSLKPKGSLGLSRDQFITFLEDVQGIRLTSLSDTGRLSWQDKINNLVVTSFIHDPETHQLGLIDESAFASFMMSKDCHVYSCPEEQNPLFDRPLNEYFISSSHNTYLTGWQVAGQSSAEAYITALRHGCRCVEIDCWNGPDGNPRVTHGRTKTSAVLFSDCVNAINRCAFDVTPYPLTISLEVHCDVEQQTKMVNIMKDVFGDSLLLHPLPGATSKLPSPEQLKRKILIKVKSIELHADLATVRRDGPGERGRSASSPQRSATSSSAWTSQTSAALPPLPPLPSSALITPPETVYSPTDRSVTATSASSDDESDTHPFSSSPTRAARRIQKMSKIIPKLSDLGVYIKGFSLRDSRDLNFQQFNHIFSLNENRAVELCRSPDDKVLFEDHNLRYMCRVYPKNLRVHSSNFDPNTFWRRGVQMVALNWQTFDAHMQMNQAMFAAGTDAYGYVLKPEYLRTPRSKPGEFEHRIKLPRYEVNFSVQIISAQQLPRIGKDAPLNPFIEVQMFSAEDRARNIANGTGGKETYSNAYHGIGSPYRRQTQAIIGNGYNPQFGETINLSLQTKYPELVFVRFIVNNAEDGRTPSKNVKQLAAFTAKLSSLQKGYRHLPLYNGHGEEFIFSTLFCKVAKQDWKFMSSSMQDVNERASRTTMLKGMISRGLSGDRSRDRVPSIDEARAAGQQRLNREIEEKVARW